MSDSIRVEFRVLIAYARSRHEPERAPRQQGSGSRSQHSFQVQASPIVVSSQRNYLPHHTHSVGFNSVKSSVWSGDTKTQYGPGNQTFMGGEFTRKCTRGKNYRALQTVSDGLPRARQHPAVCYLQVFWGETIAAHRCRVKHLKCVPQLSQRRCYWVGLFWLT